MSFIQANKQKVKTSKIKQNYKIGADTEKTKSPT
jgi:hypothetical protein